MNKQEAIKQAQVLEKELAELKKIIEAPEVTAEQRFLQLVENVEIKRDLEIYPNSIFFFNGDKFLAEYDADYPEKLWIAWGIWSVFANEYKMQYVEIQAFMREQVEKHFKVKVSEPPSWRHWNSGVVEKHFKVKVSEPLHMNGWPSQLVEKHFKMKVSKLRLPTKCTIQGVEKHFKIKVREPKNNE